MGVLSDDDELDYEQDEHLPPPLPAPRRQPRRPNVQPASEITTFANLCCEEFGLNDSLKSDVLQCSKLSPPFMMVRLYARLLSFGQDVKQSTVGSFLDSAVYKEHITRRLQCGLLDPNILYYVQGTTSRFVKHMIKNPASYQIPEAVQAHFMHSKEFSKAIGETLSSFRGEMKRKIDKSLEERQDIYSLCQKLAIRGFQLSEDHARRISLVRMYLFDYNKIIWSSSKTRKTFWDWFDDKLTKFRKQTEDEQEESLDKNIRRDKRRYPVPPNNQQSFPAMVHAPEWQTHVSIATMAMCDYHSDPNQLPDPGDDHEQSEHEPTNPTHGDEDIDGQNREHEDEHHNEHEPQGGNRDGNAANGQSINPANSLDHGPNRALLPGAHYMELDGGRINPPGNLAGSSSARTLQSESNGRCTPGAGHRRGVDPGVGPLRGSPAGSRPSPLPSRSVTPTGQPSTRAGRASRRTLGRAAVAESTGSGSSSGFNTPIASQSLGLTFGDERYDPNLSETAMATVGWPGR
ncbi:hypothetical protein BDV93DRAFT_228042 [Ceratobasidium sp. AG-I]|nr:hypothetical protein BDV93DRAFT_228042 [Ceratobasidium sp. AG-I]